MNSFEINAKRRHIVNFNHHKGNHLTLEERRTSAFAHFCTELFLDPPWFKIRYSDRRIGARFKTDVCLCVLMPLSLCVSLSSNASVFMCVFVF